MPHRTTFRAITAVLSLTALCCTTQKAFLRKLDTGLNTRCVTIDSTTNDQALDCVRLIASGAMADRTSLEAATNLETCTSQDKTLPITIVGHGHPTIIITGDGQAALHHQKYIDRKYPNYWFDAFRDHLGTATGRDGLITLLACDTAKSPAGPELLKKMVEATGRSVRAPTGQVYADCKNGKRLITFEDSTGFITVTPAMLNVADADLGLLGPPPHPERTIDAKAAAKNLTFDLADVSAVEIRNMLPEGSHEWRSVPADKGNRLMSLIEFDKTVRQGAPLAAITALVRLTIVDGPVEECRTLIIYNDRLLRDAADKRTYYYTADAFGPFVKDLLDR